MFKKSPAGIIEETDSGYRFTYDPDFLALQNPIAFSFPLQSAPFESDSLFPFFRGLLPEGWYREIVCRTLKIDSNDEFGLLIRCCKDCIGAVWLEVQ